jgi:ketosteroid isomerase-like protein
MKSRFVIAVLLILALAIPTSMLAQQSKAEKEKEVLAAVEELRQANLKGGTEGAAIFDKYIADDFTLITNPGKVFTKAETQNAWKTGAQHTTAYDLSDMKVHIYGRTAVVTGLLKSTSAGPLGRASSTPTSGQTRWTRVFVKRGGMWKCVLYQQTTIAQ